MTSALFNHIWQSTLFAAVVWLLMLLLKRNAARTRYWLWLVASVKFLIPFSLLVAAGSYLDWKTAAPVDAMATPVIDSGFRDAACAGFAYDCAARSKWTPRVSARGLGAGIVNGTDRVDKTMAP